MYWENVHYKSDKETVSEYWDDLSVRYHYNFIENSIIKNVRECKTVLDIGSGFGHWLKFYKEIYKAEPEALEPGNNNYGSIVRHKDVIQNFKINKKYDVINAIGVLHHVMRDNDLKKAISNIKDMMHDKSLFVIGTRVDFITSPKEKRRKYRTQNEWIDILSDFNIISIERSNPPFHCKKHLDLIVCKQI